MVLKRRRRKRKPRKDESPSWERDGNESELEDEETESRRMYWMLGGGALLLIAIIIGVVTALKSAPETEPVVAEKTKPAAIAENSSALSDMELVRLGEPLARKFLEAETIEAVLPFVRDPSRAEPRLRKLYPDGKIPAPGLSEFKPDEMMERQGPVCTVLVRNRDFESRLISFYETPDGLKIDWEAWVAWSETSWSEFSEKRIKQPTLFRVVLEPVAYYNFAFGDENQWVSYRLTTLNGDQVLYGYTERGSELDGRLKPPPEIKSLNATLMLKFPESSETSNQVLIDDWLGNCWSLETEPSR